MANIAAIFHWPPDAMERLSLADLMIWHGEALARCPKE